MMTNQAAAVTVQNGYITLNRQEIAVDCFGEILSYLDCAAIRSLKKTCRAVYHLLSSISFLSSSIPQNMNLFLMAPLDVKKNSDLQRRAFRVLNINPPYEGHIGTLSVLLKISHFRNYQPFLRLAVLQETDLAWRYFPYDRLKDFSDDKDFILIAIKGKWIAANWWTLENVSERLRNDREVVKAAVSIKGNQLVHCSKELQMDRELFKEAKKTAPNIGNYVSEPRTPLWQRVFCCCCYDFD